jgi:hypothetical protein
MSWSLNALETCAGSVDQNGELVDACKGCYATTGFYLMGSVRAPRDFNKQDWKRDGWVSDMVSAIGKSKYFRWFDSGDVYSVKLAWKIYEVMVKTPDCKHWLPTRMYKFGKFLPVLDAMNDLDNVVVRWSSDSIEGKSIPIRNQQSTIIPATAIPEYGESVCEAYSRGGKCADCRKCWDKSIYQIAYPQHGRQMKNVYINMLLKPE